MFLLVAVNVENMFVGMKVNHLGPSRGWAAAVTHKMPTTQVLHKWSASRCCKQIWWVTQWRQEREGKLGHVAGKRLVIEITPFKNLMGSPFLGGLRLFYLPVGQVCHKRLATRLSHHPAPNCILMIQYSCKLCCNVRRMHNS